MQYYYSKGFTLLEMMIVIAIIGILISIVLPSYRRYTQRAHFSEVVQAVAPYKIGVEECYQINNDLNSCQAGKGGMPNAISQGAGLVKTLIVKSGVITVVPRGKFGIRSTDTLILKPTLQSNSIVWRQSGGAVTRGLVR
jgi:type IV pilus assembly protein PilA